MVQEWPEAAAARDREQPGLPLGQPSAVPQELQHRLGVGRRQPLPLGHDVPPWASAHPTRECRRRLLRAGPAPATLADMDTLGGLLNGIVTDPLDDDRWLVL